MFDVSHPEIRDAVRRAMEEDIGPGDLTTQATISEEQKAKGRFYTRQDLTLAGVELLPLIYAMRGGVERLGLRAASGDVCRGGECIAEVEGRARTLLECERVALNFMQRLSGVATLARKYVEAVAGTGAKILDTRKTTPGLRRLEKMAVAAGGAVNHRFGLWDAILIKNNHITAAGGVRAALERVRGATAQVEIEVRTRTELDDALACGAQRLLLDNLSPEEAAEWVRIARTAGASVELSGGITLETVRAYAETGADFISCGAITHSAVAVDLNFRIEWQ